MSTTFHTAMEQPTQEPPSAAATPKSRRRVQREVRFGMYVLGATLGEGEFGKVKLGWRKDGKQPSQAAIKLIRRDTIPRGSEKETKIHREINSLKRLRHPNIVRLVEVLQNEKYIGIVLEYASGGELFEYILEHRYLKESMACRLFAQLVSGVAYMHAKGLVHRDLKLENLLLDKHKNIIISDFGFVNSFHSSDLMRTSCGSPCYAAPELVVSSEPYNGRKVDVWSCGIILYAMLAGYLPYDDDPLNPDGENIARLYHYITTQALTFPEYIAPTPRDLLRKIIVPDPTHRISLNQIRAHPWLAPHAPFLSVTPAEWDRNYKAARTLISQSQDKLHRRLSLMENPSGFYANPAAPQTAAVAATSGIPQAEIPASVSASSGHRRSGSSASVALHAVVAADKSSGVEKKHTRGSSLGDIAHMPGASARPFPRPLTLATVSQQPPSSSFVPLDALIPHSESNTGSIATISETSEELRFGGSPNRRAATAAVRAARPARPRPTSYHPGTISTPQISAHEFSLFTPRQENAVVPSVPPPSIHAAASTVSVSTSVSSSPIKDTHRNSWGQPKISEPALDMSMVNGVLTKLDDPPKSAVLREGGGSASAQMYQAKRRSAALDSLSNMMDSLEEAEREKREDKDKAEKERLEKEEAARKAKESELHVHKRSQSSRPSTFSPYPDPVTPPREHTAPVSHQNRRHHHRGTQFRASISVARVGSGNSEKENHGNFGTGVTNKFKRFSLLSFYSRDNATSSPRPKHAVNRKPLEPNTLIPNARAGMESAGPSVPSSRRVSLKAEVVSNVSTVSTKSREREPSTAKRVMDFFRRRSIRI